MSAETGARPKRGASLNWDTIIGCGSTARPRVRIARPRASTREPWPAAASVADAVAERIGKTARPRLDMDRKAPEHPQADGGDNSGDGTIQAIQRFCFAHGVASPFTAPSRVGGADPNGVARTGAEYKQGGNIVVPTRSAPGFVRLLAGSGRSIAHVRRPILTAVSGETDARD